MFSMSVLVKRRVTYVTIALFYFFCGVEYAVIFPSLWGYISTRFNSPSSMMGVIIAAFSVSGLFSNPLVGKWADSYPNTKIILMVTNLGEIVGSFMYFMGYSPWFLVASRLVCGIGIGGGAAMLADITRSTADEDRTGILSIIMSLRQIGLLVGPALNFLFLSLDYEIGPFHLDKYTAPGLFMTGVWIFLEFLLAFAYFNLTSLRGIEHIEEQLNYGYNAPRTEPTTPNEPNTPGPSRRSNFLFDDTPTFQRDLVDGASPSTSSKAASVPTPKEIFKEDGGETNLMIESAEQYIIKSAEQGRTQAAALDGNGDPVNDSWKLNSTKKRRISRSSSQNNLLVTISGYFSTFKEEYLRDEIVVLLAIVFTTLTAQTSFETIITPLTKEFFNYEETENSIFFLIAGGFTIIVFWLIHVASKKIPDRIFLIIGQIFLILASTWFLIFIPNCEVGDKGNLIYMIIGTIFDLFGIPILAVCTASLLSKITPYEKQAFTHGLRRSSMSIGCIIGPLWGGAFLQYRYILFAVPLAISVLFLILYMMSFKDLKPREKEISLSEAPTRPVSEIIDDPTICVDDTGNLIKT